MAELKEWLVTGAEAQDPKMALALMRDIFGLDTVMALREAKVPVRCNVVADLPHIGEVFAIEGLHGCVADSQIVRLSERGRR
jgi:hypothetical protein